MFNEKNLKKISLIFAILSILIYCFAFFGISWRGDGIVTAQIQNIDIVVLRPLRDTLIDFVGSDYGYLFSNILQLNIIFYLYAVYPVWLINVVKKGVFF